jgi:hypothetical protein
MQFRWFALCLILMLTATVATARQESPGEKKDKGFVTGMASKLNVTEKQAEGGTAAVLSLAKHHMGDEKFGKAIEGMPELDGILKKAGDLNITSIADVKDRFKTLKLDGDLVDAFIPAITDFMTEKVGGPKAKLIQAALSKR